MFIKIDENGNILAHDYYEHDDFNVVVKNDTLVDSDGDYKFKYLNGELIELTKEEKETHPLKINKNKIKKFDKIYRALIKKFVLNQIKNRPKLYAKVQDLVDSEEAAIDDELASEEAEV